MIKDWEVSLIWRRLGETVEYYKHRGYRYVDTPWIVPETISRATHDGTTINIDWPHIPELSGVLVGSAEQGFLSIIDQLDPELKYVSISPCFRYESRYDSLRRPYFMKIELFRFGVDYLSLMTDAALLFKYHGINSEIEHTSLGKDLMFKSIELGSYGTRRYLSHDYCYGTGLAEPRFSLAIHERNKS
jgi:seryl-tRNA synthetase